MKKLLCAILVWFVLLGSSSVFAETFWQKMGDSDWQLRTGWEGSYVGGCIKRYTNHYHIHLKNHLTNDEKINFHVAVWPEGDELCLGIYDSIRAERDASYNGNCKCSDDPADAMFYFSEMDKQIANGAKDALLRAEVGAVAAGSLAAYIAESYWYLGAFAF